jgi:hypothetical protein
MSNILDSIREQYEKNKAGQSSFDNTPDFSKYFAARLEDGEESGEQTIRLMPTDGATPFEEGHWHSIQVGGKWRKLYCAKHNDGGECPLCEIEAELKGTGSEEDKKISKQFKAKKFYIVRLIDRDNEADGIKFWRFPHNWKGEGALDKMIPIFTKKGDVTHPREGRDLVVILGRDDRKFTKITSIMSEDVALLTEDGTKAKAWLADKTVWRDIYKAQPVEYLQIIANGDTPQYDKGLQKFVAKGDDGEAVASYSKPVETKKEVTTETKKETVATASNDEASTTDNKDELPF